MSLFSWLNEQLNAFTKFNWTNVRCICIPPVSESLFTVIIEYSKNTIVSLSIIFILLRNCWERNDILWIKKNMNDWNRWVRSTYNNYWSTIVHFTIGTGISQSTDHCTTSASNGVPWLIVISIIYCHECSSCSHLELMLKTKIQRYKFIWSLL